jgi:HK97 family phage portal protein
MEANSYHLSLTGRTLLRKYRARAIGLSAQYKGMGLPAELFPFTAQAFKVDYDKDDIRNPIEDYTPRSGKDRTAILPHDMIDVMNVRPGKTYEGFSPSEAARREISTDCQAAEWQQVALQNRGVPDGLLVSKMPLGGEQLEAVEDQLKSRWVGMRNAHLPFVLGSDLEWLDLAKTAVEMELLDGRAFTKGAICAAFGVPSVLFDVAGATYANYETARAILMSHTVLPQVRQIADSLNIFLCPEFGPDYSIEPDLEATDALLPQLRARWEVASKALAAGVPMSQVAETFKLGVQPYDGWDVGLVPGGMVPVDSLTSSVGGDL